MCTCAADSTATWRGSRGCSAATAVGLVFAGGGARGFAHLGVWRALLEQGIEVDCVGGTSIGAVMAALVAADQPIERAVDVARRAFSANPTGDFNWLPLISLIKGGRVRKAINGSLRELIGEPIAVEDLWKTYLLRRDQLLAGRGASHR